MALRFITKDVHAYVIDYPIAVVLIVAPFVLQLGPSGSIAVWLSVAAGIAALMLAALTNHKTGIIRIVPYWLHLWVDRVVGLVFLAAPFVFGFTHLNAWYYWVLAAAVLLVTSVLNAPEPSALARGHLDSRAAT
jgi:hypothetical protein